MSYEKFCEIVKERVRTDEQNKDATANKAKNLYCCVDESKGFNGRIAFYNNSLIDKKAITCPVAGIYEHGSNGFIENIEYPYGLYHGMKITEDELLKLVGVKPSRVDDNTELNIGYTYHWSKAPAEQWAYQSGAWAKNIFSVTISSQGEISEISYKWYTE